MTDRLRIALAQLNPKVGDLAGNLKLATEALERAVAAKADILMLSELFLTGYFPEDLFFKPRFLDDAMHTAGELVRATKGTGVSVLIGCPLRSRISQVVPDPDAGPKAATYGVPAQRGDSTLVSQIADLMGPGCWGQRRAC